MNTPKILLLKILQNQKDLIYLFKNLRLMGYGLPGIPILFTEYILEFFFI